MPTFEKITVRVFIHAPVAQVWNAFTTPSSIVKWNFASDDWCCPKASNDLRKGGSFNYRMESTDHAVGFDFSGTYTEVREREGIEFVLGDDRTVTVEFRADGTDTEVVETFDAESENSLELQRNGWQAILDNFKKHAEAADRAGR
jgi:uncharacterized protein YndB with AHSA1/START domain